MDILKKNKKVIICFLTVLVIFLTIMATIFAPDSKEKKGGNDKSRFIFHPIDPDTDILKDPDYLSLDRSISLKQGNVTTTIQNDHASESGTVEFMIRYLDHAIRGDYENFKNLFSEVYFKSETVPNFFTMQRIYEITIELISETPVVKSNKSYNEYRISLDYKINRNDGTFRDDMESDCFRTQYFLITNRDGELKIDTVKTFDIVDDIKDESYLNLKLISLAGAVVLFIGLLILVALMLKKKKSRITSR